MRIMLPCLFCAVLVFLSHGAVAAQGDFDSIQGRYFEHNLIPLTESPPEGAPNYTLWVKAHESIVKMDADITASPDWQSGKKKGALVKKKLEEYKCNENVKQYNLGQYGDRLYSVLTGTRSNGMTEWDCKSWYVKNPRNPRDIWPDKEHPCKVQFSTDGNLVKGDYFISDEAMGKFMGTLTDGVITYSVRFRDGRVRNGKLTIISPTFISGGWCAQECTLEDADGGWELTKQFK